MLVCHQSDGTFQPNDNTLFMLGEVRHPIQFANVNVYATIFYVYHTYNSWVELFELRH